MRLFWLIRAWIAAAIEEFNDGLPVVGGFSAPDVGATGLITMTVAPWMLLTIDVVFPRFAERQFAGLLFGVGLFVVATVLDRVALSSERRTTAVKKVRECRQQMTAAERKTVDLLAFVLIIGIVVGETFIVKSLSG